MSFRMRTVTVTPTCDSCGRRYRYSLRLYPADSARGELRKKGWRFVDNARGEGLGLCPSCSRRHR